MDRLIYTAMSGALKALEQQAIVANNLANASTTLLFARSSLRPLRARAADGVRRQAVRSTQQRTFVLSSTPGADHTPGPIQQTGNPLDVRHRRVRARLAVQTADGNEGLHARRQSSRRPRTASSSNATNQVVLGNGGPISVPPGAEITIGQRRHGDRAHARRSADRRGDDRSAQARRSRSARRWRAATTACFAPPTAIRADADPAVVGRAGIA